MLENKCFTWNSGIFLFKASVILKEINFISLKYLMYVANQYKKFRKIKTLFVFKKIFMKNVLINQLTLGSWKKPKKELY